MQSKEKKYASYVKYGNKGCNATNVNKDCVQNSTVMRGISGYNLICSSAY